MTAPIELDLDAIEAAAKAATPGEWAFVTQGIRRFETPDDFVAEAGVFEEPDAKFVAATNPAVVLELIRRLRAAEALAASRIETIPVETQVLAIFQELRAEQASEAEEFAEAIRARCGQQALVVFFQDGASIDAMDEEQMRQAGWVREPQWQPMSEAPPFPFTGDIVACGRVIQSADWCSGYWRAPRGRSIPVKDVTYWRHRTPGPLLPTT